MKKSLLALALLGVFASAAQAQSAITIYGSIDGGLRNQTNVNAAGDSRLTFGSGTYNSNRLGFKGTEELTNGLKANFVLESGFNVGTGALDTAPTTTTNAAGVSTTSASTLFNRSAWLGLQGGFGEVNVGRQYGVAFKTIADYDPFNYKFTGVIPASTLASGMGVGSIGGTGVGNGRLDNDLQYTGTFGPVKVRAEYALGEIAGSATQNAKQGLGVSFANGPIKLGAAYSARKTTRGTATVVDYKDFKSYTLGGSYTMGALRGAVGFVSQSQDATVNEGKDKFGWGGLSYKVSDAAEITGAYYRTQSTAVLTGADGRKELYIVGATYAFSKRTNLYADLDYTRLNGFYKVGTKTTQTGVSVGINHLF